MAEKLGNRRITGTEQFYTPRKLAVELVEAALPYLPPVSETTFLEPAAGNGSFVEALGSEEATYPLLLGELHTLFVVKLFDGNQDDVDNCPDTKCSKSN